jgi:hypothetical protein
MTSSGDNRFQDFFEDDKYVGPEKLPHAPCVISRIVNQGRKKMIGLLRAHPICPIARRRQRIKDVISPRDII